MNMQICGVGGPELLIVALLGYIVFGPERAKDVALSAGRFLRRVTRSAWFNDFSRMAREIRDLPNTLIRLAELEETQSELQQNLDVLRTGINIDPDGKRDAEIDPWGIQNAVAGTRRLSDETAASLPDNNEDTQQEMAGDSQTDAEQPT